MVADNYVLVRPDPHYDKDGKISMDFNPERHFSVTGEVLDVGRRLRFDKPSKSQSWAGSMRNAQRNNRSVEYDVPMELNIGDRVIFRYNVHLGDSHESERLDNGLIVMRYDVIYAKILPDGLYPLNDLLLIELEKEVHYDVTEHRVNAGIVKFAGKPAKSYLRSDKSGSKRINVGDRVLFEKGRAVGMEWEYHAQYGLHRIRRKDIIGIDG